MRAHPTFSQYAESFLLKNIDGEKLINYVINRKTSDFMSEFVDGNGNQIKRGHLKDLMTTIAHSIDDWGQAMYNGSVPTNADAAAAPARSQGASGDSQTNNLTMFIILAIAVIVFFLFNSNDDGPAVAPPTGGDYTRDGGVGFVPIGNGQCMVETDDGSWAKPRYWYTDGVSFDDCQRSCYDTGACTAIAYDSEGSRCVAYVGSADASIDGWQGPTGDVTDRPEESSNNDDGFKCYLLESHDDVLDRLQADIDAAADGAVKEFASVDSNDVDSEEAPVAPGHGGASSSEFPSSDVEEASDSSAPPIDIEDEPAEPVAPPSDSDDQEGTKIRLNMDFPKTDEEMQQLRNKVLDSIARQTNTDRSSIKILSVNKG